MFLKHVLIRNLFKIKNSPPQFLKLNEFKDFYYLNTIKFIKKYFLFLIGFLTLIQFGCTSSDSVILNDAPPVITVSNISIAEGQNAVFTATLNRAHTLPVTFSWTTEDGGTATVVSDYTANSGSVTIPAGETSVTFSVVTIADGLPENSETFKVHLTNPTNATLDSEYSIATITDTDPKPSISIADLTVAESSVAVFNLTLSGASGQTITVDWAINHSNTSNADFTVTSGTATILAGSTTGTITIPIVDDLLDEPNETFNVVLSNPQNVTISDGTALGTITDNDSPPNMSILDASVTEGGVASVTVQLDAPSGQDITFDYATSNGTATAGSDYNTASGTSVVIPAGSTTKTLTITTLDDLTDELDETFTVNISNATNATITDSSATVTIVDNDSIPQLSINDVTVTEGGNATFTVSIDTISGQNVTFDWVTSNNTAIAGSDYTATSGSGTILAGSTTTTVTVSTTDDTKNENSETFNVILQNPVNATIADATGVATLTDNDPAPTLAINDVTITEGTTATLTVTLSAVSGKDVSFDWTTVAGTATAGTDYTTSSGTSVVIPAGSTTASLSIATTDDAIYESSENFTVVLSNPSNATISDNTGIVTLNDNDTIPSLAISDATTTEGGNLVFTVTLSTAAGSDVTFDWATADTTAIAGSDYTAASGSKTITAGSTTTTITVVTTDDTKDENAETMNVVLSNPANATISDNTGLGTINDNDSAPTISVNDVTVTEGGTATLTVSLSAVSELPVSFDWTTVAGTATAPADYTTSSGSGVTIPAGSTSTTLTVPTVDDSINETSEAFTVVLSNPANSTISDSSGTVTINDNETAPTITINDVTVTEGGTATFTISLNQSSGLPVSVDWTTVNGTAVAASDFTAVSGTATIAAGSTSTTVSVVSLDNSIFETAETFTIALSNPINATISDATGVGTINDNDTAPTLAIDNVTVTEGGTAVFTVTLTGSTQNTTTVDVATSSGTATSGSDFTAVSQTLTFLSGETSKTVSVVTIDDTLNESAEAYSVTLSNPTNGTISAATGTGTINDNETQPTLSIADASVSEGGTATFIISLNTASALNVTVDWATSSGTATSGSDFTASSGTATILAGATSTSVTVPISTDAINEPTETFNVTLTNPSNATISDNIGVGSIADGNSLPTLSIDDVTVTEGGTATFTVSLSASSGSNITFDWSTANNTAISGTDFTANSGTAVTITAGNTSTTVTVSTIDNTKDENSRTFNVNITNPTNATIADATGVGTINDNDTAPSLVIDDVTVTEGGTATFTITASAVSGLPITVDWATSSGTATSGSDFTAGSSTATIPAGSTSTTITVSTTDDTLDENAETYNITLSNPVNSSISDATGVGTINDNDAVPSISISDVTVTEGGNAIATVSLSSASGLPVSFDWTTANGTAVSPGDYTANSGTGVTIPAGSTTTTITVATIDDALDENDETLYINLSNPTNATIADNQSLITINDNDSTPTLSINDVTVTEGGTAVFTVTLSAVAGRDVTFDWATSPGTATATSDYTTASGSAVTISAGSTTTTVSVVTVDDALDEASETFNVNLTNPTNSTIADATGVGTVTDNDSTPSLSINDVTVTEAGTAVFTVTLSTVSGQDVTFDWATSSGTATSGADFTANSGTSVTIPAGSTTTTLSVVTLGDTKNEANETFNVTLSNPSNATIADSLGIGTITDDDAVPSLSIADITVNENATATLTVTLSAIAGRTVTVDYATASGSAISGTDFTATSGTSTILEGSTTASIVVPITDDTTDENDETFTVNLSNANNATISTASATVTITDNDAAPTLSVNDVSVTEGGTATFTVSLSAASDKTITFDWVTSSGTATSGTDFTANSGTALTIAAGSTTTTFNVVTIQDSINESSESFNVTLSNPSNATIADATGVGTITDDDATPNLTINDVTVTEGGAAVFTVSIDAVSGQNVTFDYATSNGTATAGTDYTAATGSGTITAGSTTTTISVNTTDDILDEPSESFNVNLSNGAHANISDSLGVGTITDNDNAPTLAIDDVTVTEGGTATFTITASAVSAYAITVDWATSSGTATSGSDFTAGSGTATIPAGSTTTTVSVVTTDDTLDEPAENFNVTLSNPTSSTIADSVGIGTINDNDATPSISINDVTITEGGTAVFTVTLSAVSGQNVSFDWATAPGSAVAGSDYTTAAGTGTITAGTTTTTVSVVSIDDALDEASETFNVGLTNPVNASISDATGVGTITDNDATPTLAIDDVTVTEAGTATFTVTLSTVSGQDVTFDWATSSGTATSGTDFTANSGTAVTIPAGTTTKTLVVATLSDALNEANETFNVTLSNPVNATIADATGIGTITDDDASPSISINDVTVTEGGNAVFTVTLSAVSGQAVTVDYATSNGSATAGSDYTATTGTATITAGSTTTTITVVTTDDTLDEPAENFNVDLSNAVHATISDAQGVATVNDNDSAPTLSINDVTVAEAGTATFTVTASAVSAYTITVDWATSSGTATSGVDFTAASGTATIAAGSTTTTFTVNTLTDTLNEPSETFNITLSNPTNSTIVDATGVGTITDDDAIPTLSIDDVTITEGGTAVFTVTLSTASGQAVTVDYATSNGTATAGSDYTAATGTATIPAGSTTATISVVSTDDTLDEPAESFNVNLSNATHATISDALGVGTINDNDNPPTLSIDDVTVTEGGTATFTITASTSSAYAMTVDWATSNGTATAGSDYTAASGTATIAAGSTTTTINVTMTDDALDEITENFNVTLSNPTNSTIADSVGIGNITDNDTAPTLSISDVTVTEGTNAVLTVTASAVSSLPITFDYTTVNGTAVAPGDYTAAAGSGTIAAGSTTTTITITTIDDAVYEAAEGFTVTISNPGNATISDSSGAATLNDNDTAPTIAIDDVSVAEAGTAVFTITQSTATGTATTVNWTTTAGTATAGSDYTTASGTATIAAGSTTTTVSVVTLTDTIDEANETFTVDLSGASGATISDASGTGTILDDDNPPNISINDITVTEGSNATFTLTIDQVSAKTITVDWATAAVTATAGSDYTTASGTATIAAGSTTTTVSVTTVNDVIDEDDETFQVVLSNPSNVNITDNTGIGTITDNDAAPTLSINDVSATEGSPLSFTITLSAASEKTVTVDYASSNGTATQPGDYTAVSGTATIPAGSTTATVNVTTIDDATYEGNETLNITLSNPTNATISDSLGIGTITENDTAPTIAINDVTVAEGGTATFTVTATGSTAVDIHFSWATSDGTAVAPGDYTTASSTGVITAGSSTTTISVTTIDDSIFEPSQTFTVTLSAPTGATISDATGVGTITDNDTAPTLSINDVTVTEGGTATFTVTQSAVSEKTTTFDWVTSDGTAAAPGDYTSNSGTSVSIAAGSTTTTFNVVTIDDTKDESAETYTITLSNPTNATISDATGVGTINDNDTAPTITIGNATVTEGGTAAFTVTLSAASELAVSIDYATADATAVAGSDYTTNSGTLTIPAGNTSGTINVVTLDNAAYEAAETFTVTLTNPINGSITTATGTGTINDNDTAPTLAIDDVTTTEGGVMTFTVTKTGSTEVAVTFDWTTSNGTALAPSDYTTANGTTVTIPAGSTTTSFNVTTIDDALNESTETFSVVISNPTGATISDTTGIGTINDNDSSTSLSINDVTVSSEGGTAAFTITLNTASGQNVTVDWATSDGTATAPSDYTTASGTATITAGSTTATVNVSTINDVVICEPNETFTVTLSNPTNAIITDATGVATIVDNDPTITISPSTATEGTNESFTVTLSAICPSADVTFNYATTASSATAGTDYTTTTGTGTITSGNTTTTITVPTIDDALAELNESFTMTLSSPTNAVFATASTSGTITDNDTAPNITVADATVTEGGNLAFVISLSAAAGSAITVNYTTTDGTAVTGTDYTTTSGIATITAGSTSTTINVPTLADALDEPSENINFIISSPNLGTITDNTGVGTITDNNSPSTLTINDVSVAENAGPASFTISLSAVSGYDVTVDWATANNSALSGSDYTASSGTATITAGNTTATVNVALVNNGTSEATEDFFVNLSNPTNATIADSQGVATITDDDTVPNISINDITVAEGAPATFTISLNTAAGSDLTINWSTTDGTAVGGSDYNISSGTATITAGNTSTTVSVPTTDDTISESSEDFTVNLTGASLGNIIDSAGVGTITDNDGTPSLTINDVSATEGGNLTFTVTMSNASSSAVTFDFATSDGTALAGSDYNANSGTRTITAGSTTKNFTVATLDDAIHESAENLTVTISNPSGATISDATGIGTINDNDSVPTLSIDDVSTTEGGTLSFTVSLSAASTQDVTFDWTTADVTAIAGSDYTAASGTATTITAGNTTKTINVSTINDATYESAETMNVILSSPTNATIADSTGIGTITDNDTIPNLSINDVTVNEAAGTASFTVTLSAASGSDVTFDWTTANVTATAGSDYTSANGTATTITAGNTTATINITIADDSVAEASETFNVVLSNASGANIIDTTGIGTITDNDTAPTLSIDDVSVTEGGALTFTVSLSVASGQNITFDWTTADVTAIAGSDYTAASATAATITAGNTSKTITVTTLDDAIHETNETLNVLLSNPTNATIADNIGIGTINDNDTSPTLSINNPTTTEGSNASFTVTLSSAAGADVTVDWTTADGTAAAASDYTAASGTLTITAGNTTGTINVTTTDDTIFEGATAETFTVTLSNPANSTITTATGTASITDNDGTKLNATLQAAGDVSSFKISPDGAMAVYLADGNSDGVNELYSVNIDGSGAAKISDALVSGGNVIDYAISADSNSVVYLADQNTDGVNELYYVDITGGGSTRLNTALGVGQNVTAFGIAANSSKVVYIADESVTGEFNIYSININGTGKVQLNPALVTNGDVSQLAIAQNSSKVVYIADQDTDGVNELYSVNMDGSSNTKISTVLVSGGNVTQAKITPNSSTAVYIADANTDESYEIFSVAIGGGASTTLNGALTSGGNVQSFELSANSSKVVYLSDETTDTVNELHSVNVAGTSNTTISAALVSGGNVTNYAISANSSKVVYIADVTTDEVFELYSVNMDGSSSTSIAGALIAGGDVTAFSISADSSKVGFVADKTTNNVFELYSVAMTGGAVTKRSSTLPTNGDVTNNLKGTPDSSQLVYISDQVTDELYELFIVSF